ncbi:uncharacterized protein LOC132744481 [Ruditapes philippinarum]|uniref:uncharacterized protein LOC132744481 n=1 Tax=Ruditapes philippinarum TaxID=129788 RepID=UPI00295B3B55|nr:uncharacterized protein LOC132744481 [Ruditapes philippinarum]
MDIKMKFSFLVLLILMVECDLTEGEGGIVQENQDPKCSSRFDTDYKLIQKLVQLEERQKALHETMEGLRKQLKGCIKSYGADDNFGVTYDFADQMAQSTCTAILPGANNYVYAVRRHCSKLAASCEDTCKHVGKKCFSALQIPGNPRILPRGTNGALGLQMYKYDLYHGCSRGSYCGPNFCCCQD